MQDLTPAFRLADNLGAVTTSAAVNVTVVNNAAPMVSLAVTPTTATAPAIINLTATAADSDGTVVKVEFYRGTTLLATITQAPYAFTWSNVPAGSYNLTAKATDNLGASTISTSVAVSVVSGVAQVYYIYSDQLRGKNGVKSCIQA